MTCDGSVLVPSFNEFSLIDGCFGAVHAHPQFRDASIWNTMQVLAQTMHLFTFAATHCMSIHSRKKSECCTFH